MDGENVKFGSLGSFMSRDLGLCSLTMPATRGRVSLLPLSLQLCCLGIAVVGMFEQVELEN